MALIGAVALIVIGPEKLPKVARTIGTLLGKAQRYVADVKAEVNRTMDLDELKKMRESMESAARDVQTSVQTHASDFENAFQDAADAALSLEPSAPVYKHPGKKWRVKQGTTPKWYKARHQVRTHALSGAARVARFRPQRPH